MNPVCSHFIVIEGLNHTKCKISKGAGVSFRASFVECTVAKLPSVVVQALSTSQETHSFHELADVARRKLPLVLLDCRERWPLLTPQFYGKVVSHPQTELAEALGSLDPPKNLNTKESQDLQA